MRRHLLPILCWLFLLNGSPAATPAICWGSDPVQPDELVLLQGGGFDAASTVEVRRLPDAAGPEATRQTKPVLQTAQSLQFVLPAEFTPGVFAVRVQSGGAWSAPWLLNQPRVWWFQGDEGRQGTPGGWLRLFGTCLGTGPQPTVTLLADGQTRELPAAAPDAWSLTVKLPGDLAPREYRLRVSNGWGADSGWCDAGVVSCIPPVDWPTEVYDVGQRAGDREAAIRAALAQAAEHGGGIVYLPRGRYQLKAPLDIPPRTILRGAGEDLVNLFWLDLEEVPPALVNVTDGGLEELSLYAHHRKHVIAVPPESERFRLNHVRIRADSLFMLGEPGSSSRGRTAPETLKESGFLLYLRGRNFQITDCDLWGSNGVFGIDPHGFVRDRGPWWGVISGNRVRYGSTSHVFEALNGLIYEDNDVGGGSPWAGGNGVTTFWNNFSGNLYYARNTIHDIYGWDREMFTLDAGSGAYFGHVAAVDGTKLTLAGDPEFHDYAPTHHTDYRGAAVMILEGTGAGQFRFVSDNDGRAWEVNRPWVIPPDATSVLSIAPFRGHHLLVGNEFRDGGAVQLYGAALESIIASNRTQRMDGLFAWGLNPHGWGWQPAWRCQLLDNEVLAGNGYAYRSTFVGAVTGNNNEAYSGPLARAIVMRRNKLHSNAMLRLEGTIQDALVERCSVSQNDFGLRFGPQVGGVVLRGNQFSEVKTPLVNEPAGVVKLP